MRVDSVRAVQWLAVFLLARGAAAECVIEDHSRRGDPVEVGFCESDAVFVGDVQMIIETMRAHTDPDSKITKHFATQTSTVRVESKFKGATAQEVTLVSELYEKDLAFVFERGKRYLIFAKALPGEQRYAGSSEKCSVQPTLLVEKAARALQRLEAHRTGRKPIDCAKLARGE